MAYRIKLITLVLAICTANVVRQCCADDLGATTNVNGAWNDAANWTVGGPPTSVDNAFIGSAFPAGSTLIASISLSANEAANNLHLGRDATAVGILDLNGFHLSIGDTFLIGRFGGSGTLVRGGSGTFSTDRLEIGGSNTVLLEAGDTANSLHMYDASSLTTAATTNFTTYAALLSENNVLTLGANLSLTGDVELRGSSTSPATIDANGFDITARDIYIGRFGLQGNILNDGAITATRNLEVSRGTFSLDANDSVANTVVATQGGTLNLHANTAALNAFIATGATLNTVSSSNLSDLVQVFDANSQLNLGADLLLAGDLELRGTVDNAAVVNANGFNITARDIYIGRFGLQGNILNDNAITATRNLEVSRGTFSLDANDSVANTVAASQGGTLNLHTNTAALNAWVATGATLNTVSSSNLSNLVQVFDANSQLNLGADLLLAGDLELRGSVDDAAVVNANGFDITARDIYIGRFGLQGNILNDNAITATRSLEVSRGTFSLDANDSVANTVAASQGGTLNLHANTAALNALVATGATLNTVSSSNLSNLVQVFDANSQLNLGADLLLSGDLELRGTALDSAVVNANGFDITARDIYIGRFGLQGNILNDNAITATRNLEVSRGTFSLDANDSVANTVAASQGGTLNLHANTAALNAFVDTGGTLNTVSSTNLSNLVQVLGADSQLNLGADLNLSSNVEIRGSATTAAVLDANGFNVNAVQLDVGRFGLRGDLLNDGMITVTNLSVDTSSLSLSGGNDIIANSLSVFNDSILTISQTVGEQTGLTLDGNSLSLLDTSVMHLQFDSGPSTGIDWAFRWINPGVGDRVGVLDSLIGSGRITYDASVGISAFDHGDGYTYIGHVSAVPEPSSTMALWTVFVSIFLRRRRQQATPA